VKRAVTFREQQESLFHAVGLTLEHSSGAGKPAARLCGFTGDEQGEANPKRTAGRRLTFSPVQESLMCARQMVYAFSFFTNQEGGLCQLRQILCREGFFAIGR